MGKTVISEELFPEIVKQYNAGGKTAAYDYLRSKHGIKHPYFVINRIRDCGNYKYNTETDCFSEIGTNPADTVFMDLDELCGKASVTLSHGEPITDTRPAAMEKMIHELISDRLLVLSRYITMDSSNRVIFLDRSSLETDGYKIVTL